MIPQSSLKRCHFVSQCHAFLSASPHHPQVLLLGFAALSCWWCGLIRSSWTVTLYANIWPYTMFTVAPWSWFKNHIPGIIEQISWSILWIDPGILWRSWTWIIRVFHYFKVKNAVEFILLKFIMQYISLTALLTRSIHLNVSPNFQTTVSYKTIFPYYFNFNYYKLF